MKKFAHGGHGDTKNTKGGGVKKAQMNLKYYTNR